MRSNQLSYLAIMSIFASTVCQMRCKDKRLFCTTQQIGAFFINNLCHNSADESINLAYPQYNRGSGKDINPIHKLQRGHTEERTAHTHDEYLPGQDDKRYPQEAFAGVQAAEGRLHIAEGFGVEHVPELQEDEYREEEGELVTGETFVYGAEVEEVGQEEPQVELSYRSDIDMLEVLQQPEEE